MIKSNTIYNVSEEEENDIATKIQAGYRGMKVRESVKDKAAKDGKEADADDSGTELSGATSPEDGKVTVVENDNPRTVGIDSGTSFSSREVTPRDATPVTPVIESYIGKDENNKCSEEEVTPVIESESGKNGNNQCSVEEVPEKGKIIEDESEEEEGDSEYTDEGESESEEEAQVAKNRTPFILLKQLVGIMKLGGGKRILPDMKEKAISGEVVKNVGNGLITENGDADKGNINENKNASLETVVKESVENIVKESVEDVVKESVQNVVKENVENVVKENVENVVKENIDNVVEKGVENVVKENVQNIKKDVKESAENVDKENVEVKESVENVVKESVKENVEDVAKERL